MNSDFAILFYYVCFLLMSAWGISQYSNKLLDTSNKNPVPENLMRRYSDVDGTEGDEVSGESATESQSVESQSIHSEDESLGEGIPQPPSPRREPNAFARFVNEHEE